MMDMHCHLDLYPDPVRVASEVNDLGIYVLSVTTTPKAWRQTKHLLQPFKRIRPALGLHPQLAHARAQELPLFEALLPETRYVGEVGLDGSPGFRMHIEVQKTVFRTILSFCQSAGGKIVSIHSRGAASIVLDAIENCDHFGLPILHWFSGNQSELRRAIDLGCWFSVGPAMTLSEKGRHLVERMPIERVLTETDGPFATVEGKPLTPKEIFLAVEQLATIWKRDVSEVNDQLRLNLGKAVSGH
jgi:TatD DNase family protein